MRCLSAVWACAVTCLAATPLLGQRADTTTTAYDVEGVRVLHRHLPDRDVVSVRLYLLGGTRQMTSESEGIEALWIRAAGARFEEALAGGGARVVNEAGADWTVTGFLSLAEDVNAVWPLWAASLQADSLTVPEVQRARTDLLTAARRRRADPEQRAAQLAWANAFRDHPYRFDPRGSVESLQVLNHADVRRFVGERFVRSRMLLVVVGAVSPEQIRPLVASAFQGLPVGGFTWSPAPPVERHPPAWRTEHRDLPTNYVAGVIHGPVPGDDSYFTFQVATHLLSGQLFNQLRTERSLGYSAGATFRTAALPTAHIAASSREPMTVYNLIIDQLEWVQTLNQVPGWLLDQYLDGYVLDQLIQDLTTDGQAVALARAELLFGDYRLAEAYVEGLREVRPSGIRRVALQHMRELQLGFVGNTRMLRAR